MGKSTPSSLYPQILTSNPETNSPFSSSSSGTGAGAPSLYPSLDMNELAENLFPDADHEDSSNIPPPTVEKTVVSVPSAILHLIDADHSVPLSSGTLSVVSVAQGENTVAVLARVGDGKENFVQWPLTLDVAAVRLDDCHYFFSFHVPRSEAEREGDEEGEEDVLSYGLTFDLGEKERGGLLKELDCVLEKYTSFSVKEVDVKAREVVEIEAAKVGGEKELVEEKSAAYWTTLAPNVEDYSHSVARLIAKGSGQLIRGILWTGDVTADRLKWGEEFFKRKTGHSSKPMEISKKALRRMKRAKKITKMSDKVANGILAGVIRVSGFFTSSIVNSGIGKKFFSMLPGEVILATLDGFVKICDAAEEAGKNVLQTSSVVTTGLVSHRYGEQAGEITHEYLHATGHALGTAWAVFKIRKALNPKNAVESKRLLKEAALVAASEKKKEAALLASSEKKGKEIKQAKDEKKEKK